MAAQVLCMLLKILLTVAVMLATRLSVAVSLKIGKRGMNITLVAQVKRSIPIWKRAIYKNAY